METHSRVTATLFRSSETRIILEVVIIDLVVAYGNEHILFPLSPQIRS